MDAQSTALQLQRVPYDTSRSALAGVSIWAKWLFVFFAVNTAVSSILLFSRASGTSAALDQLPLDDSWIHLVYIRALVTEGCLCYNTGIWEAGATSWGWVLVNAPFYLVGTEWLGIDPVFVIKFVGLLTAAVATLFAFLIVRRITGSRNFALAVAIVMSLEPTFAFSRVSGMEAPILVAAVLGSTLAILNRRYRLAGLALAFAFLSRPEGGLFVAVAVFAVTAEMLYRNRRTMLLLGRQLVELAGSEDAAAEWKKTRLVLRRATRSRSLLWISVPSALSLITWMAYNKSINDSIYPNTYLVKRDPSFGLVPIENISNVFHWGVSYWQPWLSGWVLPFAAVIYLLGAFFIVKKGRWTFIPLALFPLLMIIGVGKAQAFAEAPFQFWTRRYVDATAPVVVLTLLLAVWTLVTVGRPYIYSRLKAPGLRVLAIAPVIGLLATISAVSISRDIDVWTRLHEDYSWNSRNIADVDVAAGMWVNENLAPDESVLIADAGAIRFFGERFTYDSVGLNTHEVIGRPAVDQILTERPDALAIWTLPQFENLPNAERVALFTTPRNTILGVGDVGAYRMNWDTSNYADASELRLTALNGTAIDTLNLTDRESEAAHDYFISFVNYAPNAILEFGDVIVEDRGLTNGGRGEVTERFSIAAEPGKPLTLVLRHITDEQEIVRPNVFVDGVLAGQIPIEPLNAVAQETAFTIPAEFVTADRLEIEIRWNIHITVFRWWAVVDAQ